MKARDISHAERQDAVLAGYRHEFARRVVDWLHANRITSTRLEALSRFASGRARLCSSQFTKLNKAANGAYNWHPQGVWFVALAEVNALVAALAEGEAMPPELGGVPWARLEPLRNEAGEVMGLSDLIGLFYGLTAWPEATFTYPPDLVALTERLAEAVERAVVEAGRSLLGTGIDEFLGHYSGDRDRLRLILLRQASPRVEEVDRALPALVSALTRFTGRLWTRDRLLTLVR